jgi:hypothetical protein
VAVPLAGQTLGQCRIATGSNAAASGSIAANVSGFRGFGSSRWARAEPRRVELNLLLGWFTGQRLLHYFPPGIDGLFGTVGA